MCELCRCLFPPEQGLQVSSQLIITLSTTAAALLIRGEYLRRGKNPGGEGQRWGGRKGEEREREKEEGRKREEEEGREGGRGREGERERERKGGKKKVSKRKMMEGLKREGGMSAPHLFCRSNTR